MYLTSHFNSFSLCYLALNTELLKTRVQVPGVFENIIRVVSQWLINFLPYSTKLNTQHRCFPHSYKPVLLVSQIFQGGHLFQHCPKGKKTLQWKLKRQVLLEFEHICFFWSWDHYVQFNDMFYASGLIGFWLVRQCEVDKFCSLAKSVPSDGARSNWKCCLFSSK